MFQIIVFKENGGTGGDKISIIFGIANTDNTQWTIQSLWYFLPAGELTNLSFLCDVLTIPIS